MRRSRNAVGACFLLHSLNGIEDLELVDAALVCLTLLVGEQMLLDCVVRFGERDGLCVLFCIEADQVIAKLGLDRSAEFAGLHIEARGIELGHHLTAAEFAQAAAVLGGRAG